MNTSENSAKAILAIAILRLKNLGVTTFTQSIVDAEAARIERIFELYWIENIHNTDYYESEYNWLKENQLALRDPLMYQGDYLTPGHKETKFLHLHPHPLRTRESGGYSE